MGNSLQSFTSANNYKSNISEHNILNKYLILEERIEKMEKELTQIRNYNNVLYSQILGVDYDTTKIVVYRTDSAKQIFYSLDSVFSKLDERSI